MRIIRKFVMLFSGILGAFGGTIFLALINWIFEMGLSTSSVFLYGIISGIIAGWIIAWVAFIYLSRWIKKKIFKRFGQTFYPKHIRFQKKI